MSSYESITPYRREESRRQRRRRRQRQQFRSVLVMFLAVSLLGIAIWQWQVNRPLPGEDITVPEYVTERFLPPNQWSRPEIPLKKIDGVVIHYVGNPNTSAEANRNYFASLSSGVENTFASSHFIVGLEGEVIQCIPLTEIAYASNDRNGDTVSIEVCHPDETGQFSDVTQQQLVELTAWLCHTFDLSPETDILRHYDITGKLCPRYHAEHPEAWDAFCDAVDRCITELH